MRILFTFFFVLGCLFIQAQEPNAYSEESIDYFIFDFSDTTCVFDLKIEVKTDYLEFEKHTTSRRFNLKLQSEWDSLANNELTLVYLQKIRQALNNRIPD